MSHSAENLIEIICFSLGSNDEQRQCLYQLLSDDEKQRAARFRFDKHRNRFITGRGTIRKILANKGRCLPQAIRFALNKYGKPAFQEPETARHIQFNASSSDTMGAIAISHNIPLGFDIEKIKPGSNRDYDLIVKNQFTNDEYDWYKKQKKHERIRVFFEFWTCKEAYLKALGIGLIGKLDGFSIDLQGQEPLVSYTGLENSEQSKLSLFQLNITGEFAACLALPTKSSRIDLSYW